MLVQKPALRETKVFTDTLCAWRPAEPVLDRAFCPVAGDRPDRVTSWLWILGLSRL